MAGQRDNTLVILVSDNGASGDGGPDGSVNDMLFANGVPDRLSHKRVFLGEGIMLELIFARGSDPAQVKRLPPQDLAAIWWQITLCCSRPRQ